MNKLGMPLNDNSISVWLMMTIKGSICQDRWIAHFFLNNKKIVMLQDFSTEMTKNSAGHKPPNPVAILGIAEDIVMPVYSAIVEPRLTTSKSSNISLGHHQFTK